jgi:hypothetical protein
MVEEPWPKEERWDYGALLGEFRVEGDRGSALVGAAVIDDFLLKTLRAFMVSNKGASALLDGGTAPLGTSARTRDGRFLWPCSALAAACSVVQV